MCLPDNLLSQKRTWLSPKQVSTENGTTARRWSFYLQQKTICGDGQGTEQAQLSQAQQCAGHPQESPQETLLRRSAHGAVRQSSFSLGDSLC